MMKIVLKWWLACLWVLWVIWKFSQITAYLKSWDDLPSCSMLHEEFFYHRSRYVTGPGPWSKLALRLYTQTSRILLQFSCLDLHTIRINLTPLWSDKSCIVAFESISKILLKKASRFTVTVYELSVRFDVIEIPKCCFTDVSKMI